VVFGVAGGTVSSVEALADTFSEAFELTISGLGWGLGCLSAFRFCFSTPGSFSLVFGGSLPAASPLTSVSPVAVFADFLALAATARVDAVDGCDLAFFFMVFFAPAPPDFAGFALLGLAERGVFFAVAAGFDFDFRFVSWTVSGCGSSPGAGLSGMSLTISPPSLPGYRYFCQPTLYHGSFDFVNNILPQDRG
jgi:hypothetical protein